MGVINYLERERERDLDLERDLDGDFEGLRLPDCERDREREADLAERFDAALLLDRFDTTLPASEPLPEKLLPSESDILTQR